MGMLCSYVLLNYFRITLVKPIVIHVLKLYILLQFLQILISIYYFGFTILSFTGFFRNSNSMGLVSLTSIASIVALLNIIGIQKQIKYIFLIIFFLITCIASSSRTASMISINFFSIKRFFYFLNILLALFLFSNTSFFKDSIIYKFEYYADQGDSLNERSDVWDIAFKNINLIGNGRELALDYHLGESIYVSLMFQFGLISLFIFILLLINSIIIQFPYLKGSNSLIRFSFLPITLAFVLEGFTTSVFGSSIYWLWIFGLGYCILEKNKSSYF